MPQKRKRPQDPADPIVTRRTTRHTPVQLPEQNHSSAPRADEEHQAKRGRGRPPSIQPRPSETASKAPPLPNPQVLLQWAPSETQHSSQLNSPAMGSADLVAPEITYHVPQPHSQQPHRTSSLVRPHGPSVQPPRFDRTATASSDSPTMAPKALERPPPRADRNIDKVVLGNICFRTWYPSYYGKEVLGDSSGSARGGSHDGGKDMGGKSASRKDRHHQTMLERLYVCPCCFKYSKELVPWWGHVRVCEGRRHVPGRKVYVHPRGRRKVMVPYENKGHGPKKRRGDGGLRYVEEIVEDEGEWSIWEVDGEKDGVSQDFLTAPITTNTDNITPLRIAFLPEPLTLC